MTTTTDYPTIAIEASELNFESLMADVRNEGCKPPRHCAGTMFVQLMGTTTDRNGVEVKKAVVTVDDLKVNGKAFRGRVHLHCSTGNDRWTVEYHHVYDDPRNVPWEQKWRVGLIARAAVLKAEHDDPTAELAAEVARRVNEMHHAGIDLQAAERALTEAHDRFAATRQAVAEAQAVLDAATETDPRLA